MLFIFKRLRKRIFCFEVYRELYLSFLFIYGYFDLFKILMMVIFNEEILYFCFYLKFNKCLGYGIICFINGNYV